MTGVIHDLSLGKMYLSIYLDLTGMKVKYLQNDPARFQRYYITRFFLKIAACF